MTMTEVVLGVPANSCQEAAHLFLCTVASLDLHQRFLIGRGKGHEKTLEHEKEIRAKFQEALDFVAKLAEQYGKE